MTKYPRSPVKKVRKYDSHLKDVEETKHMRLRIQQAHLLVLVLFGALFALPTTPAAASVLPPTQYAPTAIHDTASPGYILSQPDGGVNIGCSGGTNGTKRISASGAVTQNIPNGPSTWPSTCARQSAVATDGTLFTATAQTNGRVSIQAIKAGAVKWTYTPPCLTAFRGMVIGTNGNVYVLATNIGSPCNGGTSVIGFKPTSTSSTPTIIMNASVTNDVLEGGIAAYTGGLVIRAMTGFQYVTYAGVVGAVKVVPSVVANVYQDYQDTTLAGRVVVAVRGTNPPFVCNNEPEIASSIRAFESSGQKWVYNLPEMCPRIFEIRPTPSGGVIVHLSAPRSGVPGTERTSSLLALDANGKKMWDRPMPTLTDTMQDISMTFLIDTNGNVAVQHRMRYRSVEGWYVYPGMQLELISGLTGIVVGTYQLKGDNDGYDWHSGNAQVRIGKGVWYVPAVHCTMFTDCDPSSAKLYAIKVPGLQMEYPRGGIVTPAVAKLNYVAMGDSFSSGEGVPGFDAESDTAGPPENRCHRSTSAYSRLLAATPSLRLNLTKFVACSGAEIARVTAIWSSGTNSNEAPQQDALDASTKVVTLTLGGNDIPFEKLTTACLFLDCSVSTVNQTYYTSTATLTSKLLPALAAVHAKAPNAQIYVIGYPQLLPVTGCQQTDGWMGALNSLVNRARRGELAAIEGIKWIANRQGLSEQQTAVLITSGIVEFNISEVAVIRSLVVRVSQALKDAASDKPWITYVDAGLTGSPFIGHELCTPDPYFNGLTINLLNPVHDIAYSYHPNLKGQDAYRSMILQQLG